MSNDISTDVQYVYAIIIIIIFFKSGFIKETMNS